MPQQRQGSGRADNPDHYATLYLGGSPLAAVAERLQAFRGMSLNAADLRLTAFGTRSRLGLARLSIEDGAECDLDHPEPLAERGLVPSDVATRDRSLTQAWALHIWRERRWRGVRYWSALEAKWPVIARWAIDDVTVEEVEPLSLLHPAVREAALFLSIDIVS